MVQHNAGKEGHNFGCHTVGEGEGVCRKTSCTITSELSTVGNEDDAWMILKLQEKLEKNSVQARVQTSHFDYFA